MISEVSASSAADSEGSARPAGFVAPETAALMLGGFSYLLFGGLPIIAGFIEASFGFSEKEVGLVASSDMAGTCLGSLAVFALITRLDMRTIALAGMFLGVVGNFASVLAGDIATLAMLRVVSGLGAGMCQGLALAVLSRFGNVNRNFSLYMMVLVVIVSVWFLVLPDLGNSYGAAGVYCVLGLAYVFPLAICRAIPSWLCGEGPGATPNGHAGKKGQPAIAKALLPTLALGGIFAFTFSATSFWTFSERLAQEAQLAQGDVSLIFTTFNLLTVAGCWLAYRLSKIAGPVLPNLAFILALSAVILWAKGGVAPVGFALVIFLYFQIWAICGILQLDQLAHVDPTGRFVAAVPAVQGLAMALAPFASGIILARPGGFPLLLSADAGILLVAFGAFIAAYLGRRQGVQPEASPQR